MISQRVAVLVFLSFSTASYAFDLGEPFDTPLGKKYESALKVLVVPPQLLPPSCCLAREVQTSLIFPATTNPFVTDDARLIAFASQIGFGRKHLDDIHVALSALYYSGSASSEVGIWGLLFKSEKAALAFSDLLNYRTAFIKGRLLLTIWVDNESGKTCKEVFESSLINDGFKPLPANP